MIKISLRLEPHILGKFRSLANCFPHRKKKISKYELFLPAPVYANSIAFLPFGRKTVVFLGYQSLHNNSLHKRWGNFGKMTSSS
jgi:hypothetical protein